MIKSEFDSGCDDIISSIKNKDVYIGEVLIEVNKILDPYTDGVKNRIAKIDDISGSIDSSFGDFEKYYEEHKPIVDKLHLTKERFVFSDGDVVTTHNNQIEALKYANNIIDAQEQVESKKEDFENVDKKHKESKGNIYKSRLMLREKCDPNELKKALCEVMSEGEAAVCANALNSPSLTADMKSYETAQKAVGALNGHNISATVVNDMLCDVPSKIYEQRNRDILERYNKQCAEFVGSHGNVYIDINHKIIWLIFGIISVAAFITGCSISAATNGGWWMLLVLSAPLEVICAYLYYAVSLAKEKKRVDRLNSYYYRDKRYAEKRKDEIDKIMDDKVLKDNCIFEAYAAINERVNDRAYVFDKEYEDKYAALSAEISKLYGVWNKRSSELNYLPTGLSVRLLPKIITFMESGMASDYQAAAWQAAQDDKAEKANAMLLFEQRMANIDRKFELEKQGRMQEEYNRKHLEEAKRATEAARRSEQYAKERSTVAQETLELQKKIAENTEKAMDHLKKINDDI